MKIDRHDEIRNAALKFILEHKNYTDEKQQAQMWMRDLFVEVFGINKIKVNAGFEHRVKGGYIDHLFNGLLLTEMKSKGKNLDSAKQQALDYVSQLSESDLPKFVMVSDFEYIRLVNLEENTEFQFRMDELPENIDLFDFFFYQEVVTREPQSPVNVKAAKQLEQLHSKLRELNYPKNARSLLMTRIVFCMFADDTGIFEKDQFRNYIELNTLKDGSDLISKLIELFSALNTPVDERWHPDVVKEFRYINGGLFEIELPPLVLTEEARKMLLDIALLDWSMISPIIFGSMFEGALDDETRHDLGAHFTSEVNIMKVISTLFLDALRDELDNILDRKKDRQKQLTKFHEKLSNLKFLDPACGSGNFLLLAYREIRKLEHEVIQAELREEYLRDSSINATDFDRMKDINYQDTFLSVEDRIKVEVAQFYGIEIQPYAVSIAKLGLWLMDHLMNMEASYKFGQQVLRLPLHASANIYNLNALTARWEEIIKPEELNFILGNPPFIGNTFIPEDQKSDFKSVLKGLKKTGHMDFVSAWFVLAARYIYETKIKVGFVSTNSVVQGEHATYLWKYVMENYGIHIGFAHQTFNWDNNGAKVHVVIVGLQSLKPKDRYLFTYKELNGTPTRYKVENINQYLLNAPTIFIEPTNKQISSQPEMIIGTMPRDGGYLIVNTEEERARLINKYPMLKERIRPYWGGRELVRGIPRYIIYLKGLPGSEIRQMPEILEKVKGVIQTRKNSKAKSIQDWANRPLEFMQDTALNGSFLLIPRVTSSAREYLPMAFAEYPVIGSEKTFQLPDASKFVFGILQTRMHVLWLKTIAGRLKNDINYSNTVTYNTFVFPNVSSQEIEEIEKLVDNILNIRELLDLTLRDLYDKDFMDIRLRKAHEQLDLYVERLYKTSGFKDDGERVEFLLREYAKASKKKV